MGEGGVEYGVGEPEGLVSDRSWRRASARKPPRRHLTRFVPSSRGLARAFHSASAAARAVRQPTRQPPRCRSPRAGDLWKAPAPAPARPPRCGAPRAQHPRCGAQRARHPRLCTEPCKWTMCGMRTCWISALVAFEFLLLTLPTSCRICAKTTCPKFTTIAAAKPLWASPPDQ